MGAYEEADRWRELALAVVAEAGTRPLYSEEPNGGSRGRLRPWRRNRLEEQLRDACRRQGEVVPGGRA